MKIYSIIVTHNAMRHDWIKLCIESLQRSTVKVTPIVVDNLSTDDTRKYVPAKYPDIIWLPQNHNLGFGQANNIGIKYALTHEADYVLLLNQDATIAPDGIENMLKASDHISLMSPLQLNGDGSQLDFLFKYVLLRADHQLIDDCLLGHNIAPCYIGGKYAAACWLMPIALIKKIGGFNPLFFHYSEDYNYLQRLQYHGVQIHLVPKAKMFHDRKQHGDNKVFQHKIVRRDMLLAACDINSTLFNIAYQWARTLFYSYVIHFPKHRYIPGTFLYELGWFAFHIMAIRRSRKQEKMIGENWL